MLLPHIDSGNLAEPFLSIIVILIIPQVWSQYEIRFPKIFPTYSSCYALHGFVYNECASEKLELDQGSKRRQFTVR
jgi:hypothetical protein